MKAVCYAGETVRKVSWSADFQSAKTIEFDECFAGKDARAPARTRQLRTFRRVSGFQPAN